MRFLTQARLQIALAWLPIGFIVAVFFIFTYIALQQYMRMSANDAPAEIVKNIDLALSEGALPSQFNSTHPVEIDKSLSLYVIIYDANGRPISGTGALNGNYPIPSSDVFAYTRSHQIDKFTFEPKPQLRHAVVMTYHDGTTPLYILAGHSLEQVESHIKELLSLSVVFGFISLIGSLLISLSLA